MDAASGGAGFDTRDDDADEEEIAVDFAGGATGGGRITLVCSCAAGVLGCTAGGLTCAGAGGWSGADACFGGAAEAGGVTIGLDCDAGGTIVVG